MYDFLEFKKWPSIGKFSDAYTKAQKFGVGSIEYRSKIKLHGTNAAIQFYDGVAYPQKRSDFISQDKDNAGFAEFVSKLNVLKPKSIPVDNRFVIFGEWAGPGVQKGDAVTKIPEKSFFVYSVYAKDADYYWYEPSVIEIFVNLIFGKDYEEQNIYILPWFDFTTYLPMNQKDCQEFIDWVMQKVDQIGKRDPYIYEKFGVDGPGEGLVYYPFNMMFGAGYKVPDQHRDGYMFKAKTEVHSVQNTKNRNHVAPERPEGVDDFIETFFTENRFQQMLNEIGGKAEPKKTGEFLKAVMSDVHKESQNEIDLADFEWKTVTKYAVPVVKEWWFKECNKL